MYNLNGFNLFRCDRRSHAGGVAIYVRNGIACKKCYSSDPNEQIEYIFVEISSMNNKILCGCVYRPNRLIKTDVFFSKIDCITHRYEDIVICGDFNSNILRENHLVDNMKAFGLSPINTSIPTHYTATTDTLIDVIFVSNKETVLFFDQLTASCFSKHDLLFTTIDFQFRCQQNVIRYHDYKSIDFNLLSQEVNKIDWDSIYFMPSVDDQLDFFQYKVNKLLELCVPVKTITNKFRNKPWFNTDIKLAIAKRDLLFKRWKRFKVEEMHKEYCIARKIVNKKIKSAKTSYYSSVFESAIGSKSTWKTIRNIGINKNNTQPTNDIDIDELNRKFISLPKISKSQNFYRNPHCSVRCNPFTIECVCQHDVLVNCLAIKSNAVGTD